MKITWPSGIVIRERPDGSVRYRLPRTGNAVRTTFALLALTTAGVQFAIFLLLYVHGTTSDDTIRWTVLFNPCAWLGLMLAAVGCLWGRETHLPKGKAYRGLRRPIRFPSGIVSFGPFWASRGWTVGRAPRQGWVSP